VAGGNREIEVKYRLADLEGLERALAERGAALSAPVCQDDQAFAPVGWEYGQSKIGVPFARLRTSAGQHLFTVKRPLDNEMACLEFETEVTDRGQMHAAIEAMGFYPTVRIVKTRRTARLEALSLCVDRVEQAGLFFEVETIIGPGRSGEDAQRELHLFASSLGVELERVSDTYDSLVRAATLAHA
jgi:adenylate cyclase class 2